MVKTGISFKSRDYGRIGELGTQQLKGGEHRPTIGVQKNPHLATTSMNFNRGGGPTMKTPQ